MKKSTLKPVFVAAMVLAVLVIGSPPLPALGPTVMMFYGGALKQLDHGLPPRES